MARNNQRINEEDTFLLGDTIIFSVEFKVDSILVDPALVKINIINPKNSVKEIDNVIRVSKGIFQSQYTINYPGRWVIRWEGFNDSLGNQSIGVSEASFVVISSGVIG